MAGLGAFLPLFFALPLFAHDPGGDSYDASHVDVYMNALSTGAFNITCSTNGMRDDSIIGGSDAIALGLYSAPGTTLSDLNLPPNTVAIDFNKGAPKDRVLIAVRNEIWQGITGPATGGACGIGTIQLDIINKSVDPVTPLRTMSYANVIPALSGNCPLNFCLVWDGSVEIKGHGFGKVNGSYGFKVKVTSNSAAGNTLEANLIFPGENQVPVIVDVMDIHSLVSSPTVVGSELSYPITMSYRLSKTGYVTIDVFSGSAEGCPSGLDTSLGSNSGAGAPLHQFRGDTCERHVRRIVNNSTRQGEDTSPDKNKPLTIGDVWDGKDKFGKHVTSGTYVIVLNAWDPNSYIDSDGDRDFSDGVSTEPHSHDQAFASTFSVTMETLKVIDLRVQGLSTQSTTFAGIGFVLSEPAMAYFDVWNPSTTFSNLSSQIPPLNAVCPAGTGADCLVRSFSNFFDGKQNVSFVWDGRDAAGKAIDDGDYVFSLWAVIEQGSGGTVFAPAQLKSKPRTGIIPVARGLVPVSQILANSSVFSTPPVTGVAPFSFQYSLGRDAKVNLKVKAAFGQKVAENFDFDSSAAGNQNICVSTAGCTIAHLVRDEVRAGGLLITEPGNPWDGRTIGLAGSNGIRVSSGIYIAEMTAQDTIFPSRISTMTSYFLINMLRTSQVSATPLLSGPTDSVTISYALSEPMNVRWEIYTPTSTFAGEWPNLKLAAGKLIRTIFGIRPGRVKITEFWDGRDENGFFVDDGNYITVLKSSDVYGNYSTDPVIKEVNVARGQIQILNADITPTFPTPENSSATLNIPLEPFEISYTLSRDALVTVEINTVNRQLVKRLVNREPRTGLIENKEFWDGSNYAEVRLTTGSFVVDIMAEDQASLKVSSSVARIPLSVDLLKVYDVAVTPMTPEAESAEISYQISEAMNVDLRVYKPGTIFNLAGQPFPDESESLVFFIKGPRPGRVALSELWPGINLFQKNVTDGNYVFRLTATDSRGNTISNIEHGEVPVLRLGSLDPQSSFDDQTFAYPNPATNAPVKICSLLPVDADVDFKIYTLSGELVWEKDIGRVLGGKGPCNSLPAIEWNLDNSWGRRVARGVYFYVLRADSVGGIRRVLQTRKKILIP